MVMRLRIDCSYDGTDFHGWAKQPGLRTVQGVLEDCLAKIFHTEHFHETAPLLTVAGRTDAGVHARGQVCHVDIQEDVLQRAVGHLDMDPVSALEHRLKFIVPLDISIISLKEAPYGFDARFSALERTYVYRLSDCTHTINPLIRNAVLRIDKPLDIESMQECASSIPGLKDFGSFALPNPNGTTIREVKSAVWRRQELDEFPYSLESGILTFTITADAFARSMVRSLVGAQLQVGLGKRSVTWFNEKLRNPFREGATGPAQPQGLTLEKVVYPSVNKLASRAEKIRAKRVLD